MPWIGAGLGASIALASAVFLREIVLRSARERFLLKQKRLDRSLLGIAQQIPQREAPRKLTLEQNMAILRNIRLRSDAAKTLARLAEGHREVYELCESYIDAIDNEIPLIAPGSPRLPALRKGSEMARRFHHYHLLRWVEIEARKHTSGARSSLPFDERLGKTDQALSVIDFALGYYPTELSLVESRAVVEELAGSLRVGELIERARKAAFVGSKEEAMKYFNEAIYLLDDAEEMSEDRTLVIESIREEIKRMESFDSSSSDN